MAVLLKLHRFCKLRQLNNVNFLFNKVCSELPPACNIHQRALNQGEVAWKDYVAGDKIGVASILTLEDILKSTKTVSTTEAVTMIATLNKWVTDQKVPLMQFQNNKQFETACAVLGKNCLTLNDSAVIYTFRNLLQLGLTSETYVMKSLETHIVWKMRKMSIKNLSLLLGFCANYADVQHEVSNETVKVIQRRWVEVDSINELCLLYPLHIHFNEEFTARLEDRSIQIVEKATAEGIAKLLIMLANMKRRPTPLLRAMAFHLSKHPQKLEAKDIINILCALNSLKFPDQGLLHRMSTDLQPEIKTIKKAVPVGALLTALGQMKWKHPALLESLTQWIDNNLDVCRIQDLGAYMLTMASVNFVPNESEKVFTRIMTRLTPDTVTSPTAWLGIVWSLIILQQATESHVKSCLATQFHEKILELETPDFLKLASKLKLLNINTAALHEIDKYNGPLIKNNPAFEGLQMPRSRDQLKLTAAVSDALGNFLPRGKYLALNRISSAGIFIDAELIVDANVKPLPVEEYLNFHKPLPVGANRVAVMVWNFKDFILESTELTGQNALAVRLIQALGYKVLEVPHTEFAALDTTLKKVQYLQQKIGEVVLARRLK